MAKSLKSFALILDLTQIKHLLAGCSETPFKFFAVSASQAMQS
jgi:hypothetical protein